MSHSLRKQFIAGASAYLKATPGLTPRMACEGYAAAQGLRRAFYAMLDDKAKQRLAHQVGQQAQYIQMEAE